MNSRNLYIGGHMQQYNVNDNCNKNDEDLCFPNKKNKDRYRKRKMNAVLKAPEGMNSSQALGLIGNHRVSMKQKSVLIEKKENPTRKEPDMELPDYYSDDLNSARSECANQYMEFSATAVKQARGKYDLQKKRPYKYSSTHDGKTTKNGDKFSHEDSEQVETFECVESFESCLQEPLHCQLKAIMEVFRLVAEKKLRNKIGRKEADRTSANMDTVTLMKLALLSSDSETESENIEETEYAGKNGRSKYKENRIEKHTNTNGSKKNRKIYDNLSEYDWGSDSDNSDSDFYQIRRTKKKKSPKLNRKPLRHCTVDTSIPDRDSGRYQKAKDDDSCEPNDDTGCVCYRANKKNMNLIRKSSKCVESVSVSGSSSESNAELSEKRRRRRCRKGQAGEMNNDNSMPQPKSLENLEQMLGELGITGETKGKTNDGANKPMLLTYTPADFQNPARPNPLESDSEADFEVEVEQRRKETVSNHVKSTDDGGGDCGDHNGFYSKNIKRRSGH